MIIAALKKFVNRRGYAMKEASAIYTTRAVSDLAISLIGIYLPIYIYQLSLKNQLFGSSEVINGLVWICLFYALISVVVLLVIAFFIENIFNTFHLKNSLVIGILFRIVSLVFLLSAEKQPLLLILSGIFWGARIPFYWIPYHIFFMRRADDGDHKFGSEISKQSFFSGIATSLAPLLGGLIITNLGFNTLYMLSIVLLLAASLPILVYVKEQKHSPHKFKKVWREYLGNKKYLKTTIALAGRVTSAIIFAIFWSVMLYLKLQDFVEIGFLKTFSGIVATVLLISVGTVIDRNGKGLLHAISVTINSALHLSRLFIISPAAYYLNNILDKINASAYGTCFIAATYEKVDGKHASNFITYREVALHTARLFVLLSCVGIMLLTGSWMWVFVVAAVGSGLTFLINF
ncbi:MFS transporter [candidate division WWE3 bacterium]|nr:MFS transporter [candidate division WWE3 bacterium]